MTNLPSGTVTFLFTDIEGSTKLAQEHPEKWESLRARHHAILQTAMDANNGYVFQIIGDAFCTAFHTASDAINAAADAQRNLQTRDWGETPIKVRVGIHTGEAELQTKGDYHGYLAMSRVQRLMSAGHGGQILISQATQELIRDKLPKDVTLRDMGEHKLKDVPQPVRIFQIVAPELQKDFPALRTLSVFPNNLPTQITSFVGREKELADVKKLLQDAHMLTFIGPGGTGKTRLSIQAANEMLEQYHDGVWLVELAPILDPLLVPRTTAIAIGLREEPQRPVIDMLCDYLREKKMLLILDNCEHLVDACAQIANKILQAAPHVRILASSREALGIAGEVTYRVPSLGLPDMNYLPSIESLSQYEAVKLFIDRATSAIPSFTVTNNNAPFLAQICHRLDGIPLAIELAAAKVRVLNLEQISKRLDDRFRLLTGGSRTALERHQTLRAAIDWSYNLLPPAEQTLFRRLSIFVGGWTLEAAESVCSDDSIKSDNVLELLEHLINKSIVIKEETGQETRYRMLETMRQYAREKLLEADVSEIIRGRHLAYFLKLTEQAEPELYRSNQVFWLNKLDDELGNLRMALEWALDSNTEIGLRLIVNLWLFWNMRGDRRELENWLTQFLERYNLDDALRARALVMHSWTQNDLIKAYKLANQSLELARSISDKHAEAFSLYVLGTTIANQGDYGQGLQLVEQSRALYGSLGDKYGQALSTLFLSWNNNDMELSKTSAIESLRLYRELGHLSGIAEGLAQLAFRTILEGDFSSPAPWLEEALTIYRRLGDKSAEARVLMYCGILSFWQGSYQQACEYHEVSLKLYENVGNLYNSFWTGVSMAYALLRLGDISKAQKMFEFYAQRFREANSMDGLVFTFEGLASLHVNHGKVERAVRLFAWANATREKNRDPRPPVEQSSVENDLTIINSKLNDDEFSKLSAEGRAMTIEQAIKLALEES